VYENGVATGSERAAPEINRSFGNVSGAIGVSLLPRENVNLKINVGSSYRLPTAIELTANGIHHGSLRHEKGDSTLGSERGLQFDLSLTLENKKVDFSVSPFFNYFFGYIYLNPTAEFSPLPEAGLLWKYTQHDGLHTGLEFLVDYHPVEGLHLNTGGQLVYTYSPETGYNFPMIPPIGGHAEIEYALGGTPISECPK
jgi:iron complex outermembrane receptor protein